MLGLPSATLTAITAPAIAVALSPIPAVIALVLLIHNKRPRTSSIAYLLGRSTALALLVTASLTVPGLGGSLHKPLPQWTHWITATIGVAFIALGALVWKRRPSAPTTSQWHTQIGGIPPPAAAALGMLPALVNPKVVAASVVAGGQISVLPSIVDAAIAFADYLAVATVTVAAPVITYLVLGSRIDPKLERLRHWIQRHQIAATATTLIIIGVTILLYGRAPNNRSPPAVNRPTRVVHRWVQPAPPADATKTAKPKPPKVATAAPNRSTGTRREQARTDIMLLAQVVRSSRELVHTKGRRLTLGAVVVTLLIIVLRWLGSPGHEEHARAPKSIDAQLKTVGSPLRVHRDPEWQC